MRLERRLLLYGVALPVVLMMCSLLGVGVLLWGHLVDGIDHSLRAQAAAESVSLFDGPEGEPHFHAILSPLRSVLGHPDAKIAVYGSDGTLLEHSHPGAPARLVPPLGNQPQLSTVDGSRQLILRILGGNDVPHTLWLSTSLDEESDTIAGYARDAFIGLLAFTALLLMVQRRHVHWLAGRANALAKHMERLRANDLDADPPVDDVPDVIGDLRQAIALATEQLRETRRAQDRLIAGAAHELRTPLTAMRASVDVSLRRERSVDELRETLDQVRDEVIRLDRLATELLDLAAMGATERSFVHTDLCALARESARRFGDDAEQRGVTIELDVPEHASLPLVPDLVAQAIDNLLSNALRFSPPETTIRIAVEEETGGWTLSVADKGRGVPASEADAVFLPFHRLQWDEQGTGLGLALVREVAELHGGGARLLESDQGATFQLRFSTTRS